MIVFRLLAAGILFVIAVALSVIFVALGTLLAADVYAGQPIPTPTNGVLLLPLTVPLATPLPQPTATSITLIPTATDEIIITPSPTAAQCDPSYPTICLRPSIGKTLSCADIPYVNFPVLSPDPQRFDGDKDGVGCEK